MQPATERRIVLGARRDGALVTSVRDAGPGISPENQSKIFRRFFTQRPPGAPPGTGLGLSIVESVARAHGARVEVESSRGRARHSGLLCPLLAVSRIVRIDIWGIVGIASFVALRVAVAKQRRAVETARARLAAARSSPPRGGVPVEAIQQLGDRWARVPRQRPARWRTTALLPERRRRWGGRVRLAPGAPEIGDVVLAAPPCLVAGGSAVAPGALPDWLAPILASPPRDGLLLEFQGGLGWFVAVPEADLWFAALSSATATT